MYENIELKHPPSETHVSEIEVANKHVRQRVRAEYAEFKRNTFGINMPIQFEAGITINCVALIQHVVSSATSTAISLAVLFDEEKLSYRTLRIMRTCGVTYTKMLGYIYIYN